MQYEVIISNMRTNSFHGLSYQVKIDRTSLFGNPYFMKDESMRDAVCDLYDSYFHKRIAEDGMFRIALEHLIDITRQNNKIELFCWCAPKRCHGETIKKYILDNI